MELAVLGGPEFVLGFELAGIRKSFEVEDDAMKTIQQAMSDTDIGIVVIDEKTMSKLKEHERYKIERSVKPTFVTLSAEKTGEENLRKMIVKAIGVDLLGGK